MFIANKNKDAKAFAKEQYFQYLKSVITERRKNYKIAVQTFSSIIYIANDTAGFAIFDCMNVLKKSPLYKQEVKRLANEANRQHDLYQKRLHASFIDKDCEQLYLDFADNFQDNIKKHVEILRLASLRVMTRLQVPNREVLSHILTTYCCLVVATAVFDSFFFAQEQELGVNVRKEFSEYYLKGCRECFKRIVEITMGKCSKANIEEIVNQDKDFQLACECLQKQIVNITTLDESAHKAVQTNKETVTKYIKKHDSNNNSRSCGSMGTPQLQGDKTE